MTERARPFDHVPRGSLAEEASRLAEAAQQWLGDRAGSGGHDVWAEAVTPDDGPPECRTCPVCRARRLMAGVNPEVIAHLSEAAAALAAAVRAMSSGASTGTGGSNSDSDSDSREGTGGSESRHGTDA